MYEILKDFAGPGATILASITAAYFIRRQALIAEQQANTALDQFRYNLFEKRRAIYESVKGCLTIKTFTFMRFQRHYLCSSVVSFLLYQRIQAPERMEPQMNTDEHR